MNVKKSTRRQNTAYTVEDIAAILDLSQPQVKQWLKEFKRGEQTDGEVSLTADFHTLIEFYTFYQLRSQGVWPSRINRARTILAEMMQTKYPFATANILTDGKNVFYHAKVGELIKADPTLQLTIRQVVEPFCKRIEFGEDSLAVKLYPLGRGAAIQVDPNRQDGRPVVGDTQVLSRSVFDLFLEGASVGELAARFNLSERQVEDVIVFHEKQTA